MNISNLTKKITKENEMNSQYDLWKLDNNLEDLSLEEAFESEFPLLFKAYSDNSEMYEKCIKMCKALVMEYGEEVNLSLAKKFFSDDELEFMSMHDMAFEVEDDYYQMKFYVDTDHVVSIEDLIPLSSLLRNQKK